jgi:hypothetical protein
MNNDLLNALLYLGFYPWIGQGNAIFQKILWTPAQRFDARIAEITRLHAYRSIDVTTVDVLAGHF